MTQTLPFVLLFDVPMILETQSPTLNSELVMSAVIHLLDEINENNTFTCPGADNSFIVELCSIIKATVQTVDGAVIMVTLLTDISGCSAGNFAYLYATIVMHDDSTFEVTSLDGHFTSSLPDLGSEPAGGHGHKVVAAYISLILAILAAVFVLT